MPTALSELQGVCPDAAGAVVFRDSQRRWRGMYRDGSGNIHDLILSGRDGQQASESLARYLGILPEEVHIFEATGRRY